METLELKKQWFISSHSHCIEEDYVFHEVLGEGGYGKVYKAGHRLTNQLYAVKEIQKVKVEHYESLLTEISILRDLDHPNILRVIETYETPLKCYLVAELCSGGELLDRVCEHQGMSEQDVANIMRKLFSAISYCHRHGVCHRDIKPENLLLVSKDPDSDIKLIDFGLGARHTEESVMSGIRGTVFYLAPEMLSGTYSNKVDCWSLGVVLYFMLSGSLPFYGRDAEEVLLKVYNASFTLNLPAFQTVSPAAKDLIARLIMKNPDMRLSSEQAMQHPWIRGNAVIPREPLSAEIYSGISNFVHFQRFKRATLMYIASKLNESDVKHLNQLFMSMDLDGNGTLSLKEFEQGLKNSNLSIEASTLEQIWVAMDTNKNDWIDYSEFITACFHCKKYLNNSYLEAAFQFFDQVKSKQNKDGQISIEELRTVLDDNDLVNKLTQSQIESMILEVDKNNDGHIDYREFIQMMADRAFEL